MDRKTFFKSSIGIVIAGIFAKPIIELLEPVALKGFTGDGVADYINCNWKTDAEKMLDGAKAVDMDLKILFEETIRVDENGSAYINVKIE